MCFAAERRLVSVQFSGGIVPSHPTNSKQCQIVKGLVPVSLTCDVFGRPSNQHPGKAHRLVLHHLLSFCSLSWRQARISLAWPLRGTSCQAVGPCNRQRVRNWHFHMRSFMIPEETISENQRVLSHRLREELQCLVKLWKYPRKPRPFTWSMPSNRVVEVFRHTEGQCGFRHFWVLDKLQLYFLNSEYSAELSSKSSGSCWSSPERGLGLWCSSPMIFTAQ